jgi:hypothetical protein
MSQEPSIHIHAGSLLTRNPEVAFREVDGETVMLSVETGKYYGLNTVATRIWALLAQPMTVDEICAVIVAEFEVDDETCRRDVLELAGQLAADGLVKVSDAPPA